jgi:hypothetical protein
MAYKAQLVIRSNDPNDAEVLDKIRALSEARGQTLSEVALDVLRQGLMPGRVWEAPSSTPSAASEPAPEPAASEPLPAVTPVLPAPEPGFANPTPEPAAPVVSLPPSGARAPKPQGVVREFLHHRDNEDQDGARTVLIDFFALAGPAEVHALKQALKKVLKADDFLAVMTPIKETAVYQDYKKRVLLSLR